MCLSLVLLDILDNIRMVALLQYPALSLQYLTLTFTQLQGLDHLYSHTLLRGFFFATIHIRKIATSDSF